MTVTPLDHAFVYLTIHEGAERRAWQEPERGHVLQIATDEHTGHRQCWKGIPAQSAQVLDLVGTRNPSIVAVFVVMSDVLRLMVCGDCNILRQRCVPERRSLACNFLE